MLCVCVRGYVWGCVGKKEGRYVVLVFLTEGEEYLPLLHLCLPAPKVGGGCLNINVPVGKIWCK